MKRCIALLATLLLAACGAAGGLYLPDHPHQHDNNPLRKKTDGQTAPDAPAAPATPPSTNQP